MAKSEIVRKTLLALNARKITKSKAFGGGPAPMKNILALEKAFAGTNRATHKEGPSGPPQYACAHCNSDLYAADEMCCGKQAQPKPNHKENVMPEKTSQQAQNQKNLKASGAKMAVAAQAPAAKAGRKTAPKDEAWKKARATVKETATKAIKAGKSNAEVYDLIIKAVPKFDEMDRTPHAFPGWFRRQLIAKKEIPASFADKA